MQEPLPSDIFRPRQVLNNTYEIMGCLGRGGTGEVYLARNQIVERIVAIKALNARFSANEAYLDLMKREEQMRSIVHDAVVRYSECSRSDEGHVFLVMEYIEGPSLNDLMDKRRMEDRALMIVAHRVLEGLEATHAQGIVHRDLSPDNIILRGGKPERATLIDFGIAKDTAAGARTVVGTDFAGKYEYAAPEQLDGKSDFRTDLYALGASLLAARRREVPDVGGSPGEVMRRKRERLDTSGIDAPLKSLIDWLSAPDPAERPQSATEALKRLDTWLQVGGGDVAAGKGSGRGMFLALAGIVAAVAIGLGLWSAGVFAPKVPHAAPYTFGASMAPGARPSLSGHAPDEQTAAALSDLVSDLTGSSLPADALTVATGQPGDGWSADIAELLTFLQPLERWDLAISDRSGTLTGLASGRTARDALRAALRDWSGRSGIAMQTNLVAGPEVLTPDMIAPVLAALQTCGPLAVTQDAAIPLGETITITGDFAADADVDRATAQLEDRIGDRTLRLATRTLNPHICALRAALPEADPGALSIWMGKAGSEESALSGVFHAGEFPLVDIQIPAGENGFSLWVLVADNTGIVAHALPNARRPEHRVGALGIVENGVRRIRVLHSAEEIRADRSLIGIPVDDSDFGKSIVVAIASRQPLFDGPRPISESLPSVLEALQAADIKSRGDIVHIAARIFETRAAR